MPTGCHCRILVDVVVFLLSILDSGLKFHVNITIGSQVMAFLFTKDLTGNLEIAKKTRPKFVQHLGLEQEKVIKFDMNVSNE